MSHWISTVHHELAVLRTKLTPFRYFSALILFIRLTGLFFTIAGAIYLFALPDEVTWFAKIGILFVGSILNAISKALYLVLQTHQPSRLFRLTYHAIDAVAWGLGSGLASYSCFSHFHANPDAFYSWSALIGFTLLVITSLARYYLGRPQDYRLETYYIAGVFAPYYGLMQIVHPAYRAIMAAISVGGTLLLAMIILAFQVGELLTELFGFEGLNWYYLVLVGFMWLSSSLVHYLVPKLSLLASLNHPEMVKIIMTWGMIAAMVVFYTFDWKLLMQGVEGWSDAARNNVLWSFTTYRLSSSMLESKFSLIQPTNKNS